MTENQKIARQTGKEIKEGKIGVIPTDTIYGIVCSAFDKKNVEKIYELRKRDLKKPMIVLISSLKDLELFNIKIDKKTADKYWPGKTSIILPVKKFEYLHRGKKSLAFRLPKDENLIQILKVSGPIIAPSANIEGKEPATTIDEAKKYFGENVNFYLNFGKLKSKPSKIISLIEGKVEVIRK
ncbi:MAG: L-threonylcarbamoyladenylate synthase [Minisyncoccales bacterium]